MTIFWLELGHTNLVLQNDDGDKGGSDSKPDDTDCDYFEISGY